MQSVYSTSHPGQLDWEIFALVYLFNGTSISYGLFKAEIWYKQFAQLNDFKYFDLKQMNYTRYVLKQAPQFNDIDLFVCFYGNDGINHSYLNEKKIHAVIWLQVFLLNIII